MWVQSLKGVILGKMTNLNILIPKPVATIFRLFQLYIRSKDRTRCYAFYLHRFSRWASGLKAGALHRLAFQVTILALHGMTSRSEERVCPEHNGWQRSGESRRPQRRQTDLDQRSHGVNAHAIHALQNCTSPSPSVKRPVLWSKMCDEQT